MSPSGAALHTPLDRREAAEVRRHLGFTQDLGTHYTSQKWRNADTGEILYLPTHAQISAASFIQALLYLDRSGDEYYAAVRQVRNIPPFPATRR